MGGGGKEKKKSGLIVAFIILVFETSGKTRERKKENLFYETLKTLVGKYELFYVERKEEKKKKTFAFPCRRGEIRSKGKIKKLSQSSSQWHKKEERKTGPKVRRRFPDRTGEVNRIDLLRLVFLGSRRRGEKKRKEEGEKKKEMMGVMPSIGTMESDNTKKKRRSGILPS